jgi:xanthine dehydrogenase accessory factor
MTEIAAILRALSASPSEEAALATLVSVEGSSYRRPGARMLLLNGGSRVGSISGGCLEEDLVLRLRRVIQTGNPELAVYDTTDENDIVWGVGLGCQGVVRVHIEKIARSRPSWLAAVAENLGARKETQLVVAYGPGSAGRRGTFIGEDSSSASDDELFREVIAPPPALAVFGAGDDAVPLVRLAKEVGWSVTVADSRAAYATRERFPDADAVIVTPSESLDEHLELDGGTFAVVMTHRYAEDLALLRILLARPLAYLGLLGPRKRTERLIARLREEEQAIEPESLARLCAPVGLDLGGNTPQTVALSILAEMQCWLSGRIPIPLRERTAPIHA